MANKNITSTENEMNEYVKVTRPIDGTADTLRSAIWFAVSPSPDHIVNRLISLDFYRCMFLPFTFPFLL